MVLKRQTKGGKCLSSLFHKDFYRELNFFKPDRQNGKGFNMDLASIDSVYHREQYPFEVTYASRDWAIRANKFTSLLQKLFGKN